MTIAITIILALIVIAGQFAVIVQCGNIHRRLGPRALDNWAAGASTLRALVGRPTDLERNSRFFFGSLTCGHCLTIIRGMENTPVEVKILLADAKNSAEVAFFRRRFPEITRELHPGKDMFESLSVKHLPFFLETDDQQIIGRAEQLTTVQQLQKLLA